MIRWAEVASAGVPGAAGSVAAVLGGAPWRFVVMLASVGPLVYICRQAVLLVLGWRALDKAEASRVPEVMAAITGHPSQPPARERGGLRGAPREKRRGGRTGPG
jgi:hypothetical protein